METSISSSEDILSWFHALQVDPSWSFAEVTTRDTQYVTHGYHRYPAKFIPQLARRLIEKLTLPGDLVVDPFMGSATALVEAKLGRRPSVGVDINPVAYLVARAKVTPIEPSKLAEAMHEIFAPFRPQLSLPLVVDVGHQMPCNEMSQRVLQRGSDGFNGSEESGRANDAVRQRLAYWFPPKILEELQLVHDRIEAIMDEELRWFFRCAFSHILKTCSWWHNRSVKPVRNFNKRIPSPIAVLWQHLRRMAEGNRQFWLTVQREGALDIVAEPHCRDARDLPLPDDCAQLVVTSPPYVTSYEYADLHQLTALWYSTAGDWRELRRQFIGSATRNARTPQMDSAIADRVVEALARRSSQKAAEVAAYFTDMRECWVEAVRVLKPGGYAAIVIGNTTLLGVEILNAQVFVEQMLKLGLQWVSTILRDIPSKILPQTRDSRTGKFASVDEADYKAYPREYIIIMRKV